MMIEFDNQLYKAAIKKANSEGKNLKSLIIELLQDYTTENEVVFDNKEEANKVANKEEFKHYGEKERYTDTI
ncbi:hypothetical protein VPHF99_0148 [Vibrio phage F99]|nr:hypothetical protein NVP1187O_254 [Vibrio phage 1.187.O._10N.286.49.F1]QZI87024.1 hypothetical protein MYOV085v1_p0002 [Vibrio phage 355E48.1]